MLQRCLGGAVSLDVLGDSAHGMWRGKRLGNLRDTTTQGESVGQSRGAFSDSEGGDQAAVIAVIVVEYVTGGHCCCHGGCLSLLLAHASVRCGGGGAAGGTGDDIGGSFRVGTDDGTDEALSIKCREEQGHGGILSDTQGREGEEREGNRNHVDVGD